MTETKPFHIVVLTHPQRPQCEWHLCSRAIMRSGQKSRIKKLQKPKSGLIFGLQIFFIVGARRGHWKSLCTQIVNIYLNWAWKFHSWFTKSCGFTNSNKGPLTTFLLICEQPLMVLTTRTILSVAIEMFTLSSRLKCLFSCFSSQLFSSVTGRRDVSEFNHSNSFTTLHPVREKKKKKRTAPTVRSQEQ